MSNYTKLVDFATKDSLPTGDPDKIIRGTEIETEYDNIAVAIATKSDSASPTFTGTVTIPTLSVTGVTTVGGDILSDTDSTDSLGSTGVRWLKVWTDTLTAGTLTIGAGSIVDSSGAISFGDDNLVTTGTLGSGALTATSLSLTTDLAVAHGGTGASDATTARTNLGVDAAGTDNSTNVTLAGTGTYLSLAGQQITVDPITESDISDLQSYSLSSHNHTGTYQPLAAALTDTTAPFTTALDTKLDGIETGADVTDATNVAAAGALMDSEVDADIKTLSLPASTTISAYGATLVDDADAATARATLGVVIGTDVLSPTGDGSGLTGITGGSGLTGVTDIVSPFNTFVGYLSGENVTGVSNVAIGYGALDAAVSVTNTVAIGKNAIGTGITTGADNIAIGQLAGNDLTSGAYNVLQGYSAGANLTDPNYTVAIGYNALGAATNAGDSNIAIGLNSISSGIATGAENVAIGNQAGMRLTTGAQNVFIGPVTGASPTTGSSNIGIGTQSMSTGVTTGSQNVCLGVLTGNDLTSGAYNILQGSRAGFNLTTAQYSVAVGYMALGTATNAGLRNIAIGRDAIGAGVATGADNIAVGYQAGQDLTSGASNVLVGKSAGANITTASSLVAIGNGALDNSTAPGDGTIAIGRDAMGIGAATGASNLVIGDGAGRDMTLADYSVLLGYQAGYNLTTADYNVGIGFRALGVGTVTGLGNVAIGADASNDMSSGAYNTFIGYAAGKTINFATGSNTTAIGNGANPSSSSVSNEITLGNDSINAVRIPGASLAYASDTWDFGDKTIAKATLKDYGETTNAIGSTGGGTQDIDLTLGNSVSATVDTSANTFTFSNPTASDELCGFTLYLVNGGSQTVTWPASVDWPGGTAPTLTASGTDKLVFETIDGGTTWLGNLVGAAYA